MKKTLRDLTIMVLVGMAVIVAVTFCMLRYVDAATVQLMINMALGIEG